LFLFPSVKFLGGLFQLFKAHGADDLGQDVVAFQSVFLGDLAWVLQLFGDFLGDFPDDLVNVDVLGGLDGVSHVSDEVRKKRDFWSLAHLWSFLYPFFAAGDA